MTALSIKSVGLCADYSPVGDRALRYALTLATHKEFQLNIFSFLQSPYGAHGALASLDPEAYDKLLIQKEYELREYYDGRLRDYLDVGFRVCEGKEETQLRRCLKNKEYEVLVGPWRRVRYYLNAQAAHIADKLHLYDGSWRKLPKLDSGCPTC